MVFGDGVHLYVYPKWGTRHPMLRNLRSRWPDPARVAAWARPLGIRTLIFHDVTDPLGWLTPARQRAAQAHGVDVAIGCGSRGPGRWQMWADSLAASLERGLSVVADWEGAWDHGARLAARLVAERVQHRVGADVWRGRVADVPWWAPLYFINSSGRRIATHPDAPTAEFGQLCIEDRYPQCYGAGAGEDASARMLAWARSGSQYARIASAAGLEPWTIRPCLQAYRRSLNDHVRMFTAERSVLLWHHNELDTTCELALKVVAELRGRGFTGPTAVRNFQAAAGLVTDAIVGPKTLGALGLQRPG